MIASLIACFLLLLLALGLPVAFALLICGATGLYMIGGTTLVIGFLKTVPQSAALSYELITVPMFLLMAELVIISGIAHSLFKSIAVWFGRVPGGLGIATAIAGAGFGALSGSSTAAAATLASTSVPAMLEQGYEPKMATGVVAISGTLAMLIPPSIALILYGLVANVSIGRLLIAGVLPGILVTVTISLTVVILVLLKPERAPLGSGHSWGEKIASLRVAGPVLLLFGMVTGVIYLGVATPTEASALGAFGALILAILSGRLTLKKFADAVSKAGRTTAMIIMIIMCAHLFGYFFTISQTTRDIVHVIGSLNAPPIVIMTVIILMYLLLGCFLDQVTIIILTVPVILPLVVALGYDPVWFGVVVVVTAEVGMVTPPVGINVFVVASYTRRRVEEIFAGVTPHVIAHILLIAIFVLFPQIILWLPAHTPQ